MAGGAVELSYFIDRAAEVKSLPTITSGLAENHLVVGQRRILTALAKKGPLRRVDLARVLGRKSHALSVDLGVLLDWMEIVRSRGGVYEVADPVLADWLKLSRFAELPVRVKRRRRAKPGTRANSQLIRGEELRPATPE